MVDEERDAPFRLDGQRAVVTGASRGIGAAGKSSTAPRCSRFNVNAIAPGYIATEMNVALIANETRNRQILERIPVNRWGNAEDMASAAVFLASPAASYVNGHLLVVDSGWMGR